MEFDEHRSLEPAAPFRFLNHSCRPNCELVVTEIEEEDGTPAGVEMWVETLSDIRRGEQLTIDYAWPADSAIPCECGSPDCRGWVVAASQLDRLPRASSAGPVLEYRL
jgi:SET domain-containing protein